MALRNAMPTSRLVAIFLMQLLANEVIAFVSEQKAARIQAESERQIVLGGLFPVHAHGSEKEEQCGPMLLDKGIQRLEAMLYAIDRINNDPSNWNFKMGATILDTCSSESYALEQSLQFLHYKCGPSANIGRKVTAVVGASNSLVTAAVANIFRLFKIPQVSYASTSEDLDDLLKYPYFFRVVPSDRFQVQVILDILLQFEWTYVSMVVAKWEYGEKAKRLLQDEIRNSAYEICFANIETLPKGAEPEDYEAVVNRLNRSEKAKVVIVFLNEDKVVKLLDACERSGILPGRFVFIGSDGWGTKDRIVQNHQKLAEGAITILPKRYPVEGFDEYFTSLRPSSNTRNPWFKEYWETRFDCVFDRKIASTRKRKTCKGNETLGTSYKQEGLVPMVIDSVHLLALAINTLCEKNPSFCKEPEKMDQKQRDEFLRIIRNTTFNSSQGHDMVISFDNRRSVPVNYTITEYRKISTHADKHAYSVIGEWNPSRRLRMLRYPDWLVDGRGPVSRCSDECGVGEEHVADPDPQRRCCWTCRQCDSAYYLPDPKKPCEKCPKGTVPSSNRRTCTDTEIKYLGRELDSAWALIPLLFSILGLISTTVVLVIFFLYRKTPLIMASGRELCYFILAGIAVCYCYSFVVLSQPTEVSCGALRIGMGLGLSICYSAIFTKTNRLSRIFEVTMKAMKRPSYISPESQIMICVCLVLIQVTLTVLWLIIKTPEMPTKFLTSTKEWVTYCEMDEISLLLGLLYNMILLILCTIYAYKTRNLPDNFNETKWISFTMYASCIIWLAFIPMYCGADNDNKVQSTILAMNVSASGTIILVCMFLPKIYVVVLHPERNVRYPSAANTGTGTNDSGPPVRYLRGTSATQDMLQQPSPNFSKSSSGSPFLLRQNHIK